MVSSLSMNGPSCSGSSLRDESELIARLQSGDDDAYKLLVRTHSGPLMAIARRFFGDTDAAEAVQDAFVSAFKAMPTFSGGSRLRTWLHRIVVNACLMKIRARNRSRFVPLDGSVAPLGRPEEDRLCRAEMVRMVKTCIDQLPPAYQSVIRLRDLEGMDTREAADRLGTNEGAVKVRLHRARQALRAIVEANTTCDDYEQYLSL